MTGQPVIHELNPSRLDDFLAYFDHDAFPDNPDWASCYCYFYLANHQEKPWSERTGAENRAAVSQLIAQGKMHGYLAYLGEKPVGWCHAAPRLALPALQEDDDLQEDVERVGAIVCFNIALPYRRLGIARSLLEVACQGLRRQGMAFAEAYPRTGADSDAANYHGPLQMYLEAGFEPIREFEGFVVVHKVLEGT